MQESTEGQGKMKGLRLVRGTQIFTVVDLKISMLENTNYYGLNSNLRSPSPLNYLA